MAPRPAAGLRHGARRHAAPPRARDEADEEGQHECSLGQGDEDQVGQAVEQVEAVIGWDGVDGVRQCSAGRRCWEEAGTIRPRHKGAESVSTPAAAPLTARTPSPTRRGRWGRPCRHHPLPADPGTAAPRPAERDGAGAWGGPAPRQTASRQVSDHRPGPACPPPTSAPTCVMLPAAKRFPAGANV